LVVDINGNLPTKEILRAMLTEYAYPGYRKILGPGQAAVFGISKDEFRKAASTMSGSELSDFLLKKADSYAMPLGRVVEMLDKAGVSRTCVLTEDEERTTGLKPVISNEYVGEIVKEYPDKFIGFAGADPLKGKAGVMELERAVSKLGLRGLCLVPFRCRMYADDRRYYPLYAKCEELGIPVWIHSSNNWSFEHVMDYGNPRRLDRVAVDFPELRIIAGHGGWPWVQEMVVVAWRHPNVYIDTSAHRPAYFTRKGSGWEPLLHFGNTTIKQKVVFGSEWMVLGIPIAQVVEEIRQLPLKEDVKELWLHENARRVLSL
jgi:predicted TIM-barrel fold metal-dependent hydrolase